MIPYEAPEEIVEAVQEVISESKELVYGIMALWQQEK